MPKRHKMDSWRYQKVWYNIKKCEELGIISKKKIEDEQQEEENRRLKENPVIKRIIEYKEEQGLSDRKIAGMSDIPWNQVTVSKYVRKCKELGWIQEEKVEEAKRKQQEKEKNEWIKSNETIQRIITYKKKYKLSDRKIAEKPDIPWNQATVSTYIRKCRELGLLPEKDDDRSLEEKPKRERQRTNTSKKQDKKELKVDITLDEEQVKSYVLAGYEFYEIKTKIPVLVKKQYDKILESLKAQRNITDEEIEAYAENRKREIEQKILEYLKRGCFVKEISKMIDCTEGRTRRYIENVKEKNQISEEDILLWRNERPTSPPKRRKVVLKGYLQGLTQNQIVKEYPEQELTKSLVLYYREVLIKENQITREKIEEARQKRQERERKRREEQKIKSRQAEERQKVNLLRREIKFEVEFKKEPSLEKKEKIREYIDTIYKIYADRKMPKEELLFLKQAIQTIPIKDEDMIKFAKICIKEGEYTEALEMIKNRDQMKREVTPRTRKKALDRLEKILYQACKVSKAIQIIKKGNINTKVISEVTGLSEDEINCLKIKLSGKQIQFLNIVAREKILKLLQNQEPRIIQRKFGISDLEMADIEKQVKFRNIEEQKRDRQAQIKQDSTIRIVALYTKLGKKVEQIAKVLERKPEEIEEDKRKALEVGLLKANEIEGMEILDSVVLNPKELQI